MISLESLTLRINQLQVNVLLRNQQQTLTRVKDIKQTIRYFNQDPHPFIVDYYTLTELPIITKFSVSMAKQTQTLQQFNRKDQKLKSQLNIILQIIEAVEQVHSHDYVLLGLNSKSIYLFSEEGELNAKLPVHGCWKTSSIELINGNRQLIKSALSNPQFHKKQFVFDQRVLKSSDLWSLAILIFNILWIKEEIKIDLTKYNIDQQPLSALKYDLPAFKRLKFNNQEHCINILMQCLNFSPERRPKLQKIKENFLKAVTQNEVPCIDKKAIDNFEQTFHVQQLQKQKQFQKKPTQIFALLSEQLKKRLNKQFQTRKMKVKEFRPLFKASIYDFSAKYFHEICDHRKDLLIIYQTLDKKKFCSFTITQFDLEKTNGLFGDYSIDQGGQSFIYSVNWNQYFNIKDKTKCIGNSWSHGPVIGESDIVIGNGLNSVNFSRLKSYEPAKTNSKSKLTNDEYFNLLDYEVYELNIERTIVKIEDKK